MINLPLGDALARGFNVGNKISRRIQNAPPIKMMRPQKSHQPIRSPPSPEYAIPSSHHLLSTADNRPQLPCVHEPGKIVPRFAKPLSVIAAAVLALGSAAYRALAQTAHPAGRFAPSSAPGELLSTAAAEESRGIYVFYTQTYIDTDNERASYAGSIYGALQSIRLNGCKVTATVALVDRFSGMVGNRPAGRSQDNNLFSAAFTLTPAVADALTLTVARPIQLAPDTHAVCTENPSCSFTWLAIRTATAGIREVRMLNGLHVSSGAVSLFQIPLSSAQVGNQLIRQLRDLTHDRCR